MNLQYSVMDNYMQFYIADIYIFVYKWNVNKYVSKNILIIYRI